MVNFIILNFYLFSLIIYLFRYNTNIKRHFLTYVNACVQQQTNEEDGISINEAKKNLDSEKMLEFTQFRNF